MLFFELSSFANHINKEKVLKNFEKVWNDGYGSELSSMFALKRLGQSFNISRPALTFCTVKLDANIPEGLREFFDDPANYGKDELDEKYKPGRPWSKDELRLKSNSDLHKLWYVLLKERNMLLTMQEACVQKARRMPNPDRIEKVAESMYNLESVIHERNDAYFRLETGDSADPPMRTIKHRRSARSYINDISQLKEVKELLLSRLRPSWKKSEQKTVAKIPEMDEFLLRRDYIGAMSLLQFQLKDGNTNNMVELWLGHCAFRAGEYRKAISVS
ncbi:39S ribosomal protein L47, mitochondrial [Dirofilaria immitis]|nr:39S ribosomal protein L47, mitochondrial [Dirofilaria immitis]